MTWLLFAIACLWGLSLAAWIHWGEYAVAAFVALVGVMHPLLEIAYSLFKIRSEHGQSEETP